MAGSSQPGRRGRHAQGLRALICLTLLSMWPREAASKAVHRQRLILSGRGLGVGSPRRQHLSTTPPAHSTQPALPPLSLDQYQVDW